MIMAISEIGHVLLCPLIIAFDEVERKPNFVALCKVIVWKTHIPVRTQKWPPLLIFAGARQGIVINHVTGHSY